MKTRLWKYNKSFDMLQNNDFSGLEGGHPRVSTALKSRHYPGTAARGKGKRERYIITVST